MRTQLIGTWLIGSVAMGTVALLVTANPTDGRPFQPLLDLPRTTLLLVLLLGAGMFAALFVLGWRTQDESWLPADPRAPILWTVLVGGAGLVGWTFAAAVTFAAEFSLTAQLLLAYLGGGLPFTLVAGMLGRRVVVNWVAVGLTAVALLAGVVLMPRPISSYTMFMWLLIGGGFRPL